MHGGRIAVLGLCFAGACRSQESTLPESAPPSSMTWHELPSLGDPVGVAGAFVGTSGGALLVAGGANFPDGRPWDGASKVWHDTVWLLGESAGEWRTAPRGLPAANAYGVSVTWDDALVCAGGGDALEHRREVYALRWDGESMRTEPLPPMPGPTAFGCGAVVEGRLYVAGGIDAPAATRALHVFWSLDLRDPQAGWETLEPWPGEGRMLAVAGEYDRGFVLASGVRLYPDESGAAKREYLRDAYHYRPGDGWERLPDLPFPAAAAPSPAFTRADGSLALIGGDDGGLVNVSPSELKDSHPGFRGRQQVLDPEARAWNEDGRFLKDFGPDPFERPEEGWWPAVTTGTARWNGMYVIASGEARPGVRTARVFGTRLAPD